MFEKVAEYDEDAETTSRVREGRDLTVDSTLLAHSMRCPNCDRIVDAIVTDNHVPAIVRCEHCGYSDLDEDQ
jgi:hypothetical protein